VSASVFAAAFAAVSAAASIAVAAFAAGFIAAAAFAITVVNRSLLVINKEAAYHDEKHCPCTATSCLGHFILKSKACRTN